MKDFGEKRPGVRFDTGFRTELRSGNKKVPPILSGALFVFFGLLGWFLGFFAVCHVEAAAFEADLWCGILPLDVMVPVGADDIGAALVETQVPAEVCTTILADEAVFRHNCDLHFLSLSDYFALTDITFGLVSSAFGSVRVRMPFFISALALSALTITGKVTLREKDWYWCSRMW